MRTKSLLIAAAMLTAGSTAALAQETYPLEIAEVYVNGPNYTPIYPEGSFESNKFGDISLSFDVSGVKAGGETLHVSSDSGFSQDVAIDTSMLSFFRMCNVSMSDVVVEGGLPSGRYTLTVPAGFFTTDDDEANEAVEYWWDYTNPDWVAPEPPEPLEIAEVYVNGPGYTPVYPEGSFESNKFGDISLSFDVSGVKAGGETLHVSSDSGFSQDVAIDTSMLSFFRMCNVSMSDVVVEGGLPSGRYTLTVPAGFFTTDDNEANEAVEYWWDYTNPDWVAPEPDTYPVSLEIADYVKASFGVAPGQSITLNLVPDQAWKVATLTVNGEDKTADIADDAYTVADIHAETALVATLEYGEELSLTEGVDVAEIPATEIKVYNDGAYIAIDGLTPGQSIEVFTAAGMLITREEAKFQNVRVEAPADQIYIIRIGQGAVKIRH